MVHGNLLNIQGDLNVKHLKTVSAYFGDWCNKLTYYMYMYINLLNLMPSYILYYN